MRRIFAGLAIPLLTGIPVWLDPSWTVGVVALAAGMLCLIAVWFASLALVTAGGAVALGSLVLALRAPASSIDALAAAFFGLALLLLADGVHLCRRYEGAAVAPALWRRQAAWWTARGAISLALAAIISLLAPLIALGLPPSWAPFVAGIGILAALAAAAAFAWSSVDD